MAAIGHPSELAAQDQATIIHPLHDPELQKEAIIFASGRGAILTDVNGREYIDGLSCLWNVSLGHGRAELAEAAAAQMVKLGFVTNYTGAAHPPAIELGLRLREIAYPNLTGVFFTSGGAESNESAFKTARFYWKAKGKPDKVKIISREHGYHGVTLAAMSATGMGHFWKMFEPRVPNFLQIPAAYPYRFEGARPGETIGAAAARLLEEAILGEGPDTVAGFLAEPVPGGGGVLVPPDDYFPRVREICTRHQVLLIADEVITGFGRTGRWFALEHWGVQPDIMSFAKGITSGYLPLGGIMVSDEIHQAIRSARGSDRWMHAFTYSGHPTCCAVGLRVLEIIGKEKLLERVERLGKRLLDGLKRLEQYPVVGDVRGLGLMAAVEFVADRVTKADFPPERKFIDRLRKALLGRGILTRVRGNTACFAPPFIITEAQIDAILEAMDWAVPAVAAGQV
jgi:adenosylmethionine-8-amino-7-oxononanoate aminotransferase